MNPCQRMVALMAMLLVSGLWGCIIDEETETTTTTPILYPRNLSPEAAALQPRIQFFKTYATSADIEAPPTGFEAFITGTEQVTIPIVKPYGIAAIRGKIFVCDPRASRVVILDLENQKFDAFGGNMLQKPHSIVVDPMTGNLFVADLQRRDVVVFNKAFEFVFRIESPELTLPLGKEKAEEELSAELIAAIQAEQDNLSESMEPMGMVIRGDNLFVCDLKHHRVLVFDKSSGEPVRDFGYASPKQDDQRLVWPTNIALDPTGRFFISDSAKARIGIFSDQGEWVDTLGSLGKRLGKFTRPKGIAINRDRLVYVVDAAFENVQVFDAEKRLLMFFPESPGNHPGGLYLPAGIAVDYENLSYFEDRVAPGYRLRHLILVTSQFGRNKVNVYGLLDPVVPSEESEIPAAQD